MGFFDLGGGGRFQAYAKAHGYEQAVLHCYSRYGREACQAMHKKGEAAAPQARRAAKRIAAEGQ